MRVEGSRVVLRNLRFSDARSLQENANDPEVTKYIFISYPYPLDEAKDLIKEVQGYLKEKPIEVYFLGVELKETGKIIGAVSFRSISYHHRNAELSYWLGKEHWGKGLMSEAVRLMLNFGFEKLGLEMVYSFVYEPNIISVKLLEKLGFKYAGMLRKGSLKDGRWYNNLMYDLLKEEVK